MMAGMRCLDADALAQEKAAFIAFYKAKGWPPSHFVPHSGGQIEFGRAATQDKWEGWRDRASLTDRPSDVFVPHAQCVAAGGDCLNAGRCISQCRERWDRSADLNKMGQSR